MDSYILIINDLFSKGGVPCLKKSAVVFRNCGTSVAPTTAEYIKYSKIFQKMSVNSVCSKIGFSRI